MSLKVEISHVDMRTYQVKLAGSLDTETAEQLDQRMREVLTDPAVRTVRLDLHDLKFISSLGLGSLSKIKKALAMRGGVMVTIGAQPQIAHVFEIVRMLPKETVFVSHAEADEYLAAIQKNMLDEQAPPPQEP